MEGGRPDDVNGDSFPAPANAGGPRPDGGIATAESPPGDHDLALPWSEAKRPAPMHGDGPAPTNPAWYRTDQQRYRSVHRRANPWYRRITRFLIGSVFLAAAAVGVYFGAREVIDYIERDRLPPQGVDLPTIRTTSFQIRSSSPAPSLDGTLTIDTETLAFEFVGGIDGPDRGWQVVSPDSGQYFVRQSGGAWREAAPDEAIVAQIRLAVAYLADDDSADDILTSHLRRGFVDLVEREFEGVEETQLTRYQMIFDTQSFSTRFPLQWQDYRDHAIPGIDEARQVPVIIWLDSDSVLVRVRDEATNWAWERLTYSDQPFRPADPSSSIIDVTSGLEGSDGAETP